MGERLTWKEIQNKYPDQWIGLTEVEEDEMQRQQRKQSDAKTTAERNAIKKEISVLDKKIVECSAYDELLNHATGNIQNYVFDLDDGRKTNYAKFLSIDGDTTKNILTVIKL